MTLHLIKHSPFQSEALQQCIELLNPKDSLLLLENGVYGLIWQPEKLQALSHSHNLYLLESDAATRGFSVVPDYFTTVDYEGFVNLTLSHQNSISW